MYVQLRPIRQTDWETVHTWAQLEEVCRYQPWGPNTPAQTRDFVTSAVTAWAAEPRKQLTYVIEAAGDACGVAGLTLIDEAQAELGYSVHPRMWRRGVATAAARELLRIGFAELGRHRVFGTCDPRNAGSAAVMRKIGMTHEGRLRETKLIRDGWRDSEIFGILAHEWAAGNSGDASGR